MRLSEALWQGLKVVNKNWQLVGMQLAAAAVNVFAFVLIVVLPAAVSVAGLGGKILGIREFRDIPALLGEFVTMYVALFAMAAALGLLYTALFIAVSVFTFGASSGLIARGVSDPREKFTLRRFFSEGKRLFFTMLRYAFAAGLLFVPVLIVILLLALLLYSLAGRIRGMDTSVEVFVGVFAILLLVSIVLFLVTFSIALFLYGAAAAAFKERKGFASLMEGARFLLTNQKAYWLYCVLFFGSVALSLLLALAGMPLRMLPSPGILLSFPYQLFSFLVQTYLGFYVSSVLFTYYHRARMFSDALSIRQTDTVQQGSPSQGPLLPP